MKQVLSVEQMKHLQELGLDTSDASMHWQYLTTADAIINGTDEIEEEPCLFVSQPNMKHEYPAYTLQDILDKLPQYIHPFASKRMKFTWVLEKDTIAYRNVEYFYDCFKYFTGDSSINIAYDMLCWCIEKGYVKTKE